MCADGVTVAKSIELPDYPENMGAQMVREVASKTSEVAGDGTTTATVLARTIIHEAFARLPLDLNPDGDLKRGIDMAVTALPSTRPIKRRSNTGCLHARRSPDRHHLRPTANAPSADMMADAKEKVGKEGADHRSRRRTSLEDRT